MYVFEKCLHMWQVTFKSPNEKKKKNEKNKVYINS